jgi:hypothetical protein
MSDELTRDRNRLGIKNVDRIYDRRINQLTLLVNTREMLDGDVNASLHGDLLIMEAPIHFDYSKSFLNGFRINDMDTGSEIDIQVTGIAEMKLKHGYRYKLVSCRLVHPRLVKIILRCNLLSRKTHRK